MVNTATLSSTQQFHHQFKIFLWILNLRTLVRMMISTKTLISRKKNFNFLTKKEVYLIRGFDPVIKFTMFNSRFYKCIDLLEPRCPGLLTHSWHRRRRRRRRRCCKFYFQTRVDVGGWNDRWTTTSRGMKNRSNRRVVAVDENLLELSEGGKFPAKWGKTNDLSISHRCCWSQTTYTEKKLSLKIL